jgi:dihydrofolate synthase/folylpolyglutamate synthase
LNAPEAPRDPTRRALADWLEYLETLHPKKIDLSLERVISVLDTLELRRPPYRVLTIGGTNGKGSCVAMLEAVYASSRYRVGAYTSPHLWRFNERIRVDGREASDAELTTIAACLFFARQRVDVALLEVGLGGRLDAVNAVEPDLALVTSIAMDHEHWLGTTRDAIGREKAGIFRGARPAVVGDPNAPATLIDYATDIGADLWRHGTDFDIACGPNGQWSYRGRAWRQRALPRPSLGGDVQYANAAACVAVLEATQEILPVDASAIDRGMREARIHARREAHRRDGIDWLFDVAHNPAATATLSRALAVSEKVPTLAIVGLMADKRVADVLAPLVGQVDEWIVTRAQSERAADPESLVEILSELSVAPTSTAPTPETACAAARASAVAGSRIVVFGSFQIVGPVMAALELYSGASSSGNTSAKWTGV